MQRLRLIAEVRKFSGFFCGLLLIAALGDIAIYQRYEHNAIKVMGQIIQHVNRPNDHIDRPS